MKYELIKLNYSYDALEPYIDAKTMEIHHSKHHQAYVNNLNAALEKHPEMPKQTLGELLTGLDKIPEDIKTTVKNNAGGVFNHNFFWQILNPKSGIIPMGNLQKAINTAFTSFDNFKQEFTKCALGRFGSGWAWLVLDKNNKLMIYSTANQDSPIPDGLKPLLTLDVWEHAYYLKYQNRRPEYIENWWNVVNWQKCEELYNLALKN